MIEHSAASRADQSHPTATDRLRIARLSHRFGLPLSQAALVAGIFWEAGHAD